MSTESSYPYPFYRIFIGPERTVVICGPQIFVLNSESGALLASTSVNSAEKNVSSIIRVSSVDNSYRYLVTSGDDKRLRVWSVDDLRELSCREIPKRANVLRLSQDSQTILVADKFGDIFSYPLTSRKSEPQPTRDEGASGSKFKALALHDNPEGALILGHASIITDFILTHDEKLIISADRDEHIRVSWYPEGWDVERYCMGHKKFVSALEVPSCAPSILISGGGDPDLYIWEFRLGRIIGRIPIWEHIRPFIRVKGGRRRSKEAEKKGSKSKKNKRKNIDVIETLDQGDTPMDTSADDAEPADEVLVISQITYAQFGGVGVILLSAVGSSALLYFEWPSTLNFNSVEIRSLDLCSPIIEFLVMKDEKIWVSVDSTRSATPSTIETTELKTPKRIRQLVWKDQAIIEDESESVLVHNVHENCIVNGTPSDIQALNLYEPLVALPKTMDSDDADGAPDESHTPVPAEVTSGPGLRASARQKAKEQLEKRKALTTQEMSDRAAKQPRVDET